MPPTLRAEPLDATLASGLASIRTELGIEAEPPPDALREAQAAAAAGPSIAPDDDLRHLPFVTIDPVGSRDLDQALHLAADGTGWVVHYAIADVAAFVVPGGALDRDARARGSTVYLPDGRVPLHPTVLSEGAASLLPDAERQAVVWRIAVGADGEVRDVAVRRALVRSRRAHSYEEVQAAVDGGDADEALVLLRAFGEAREARQLARGGLDLHLPDQVVVCESGTYQLAYRTPVPAEGWNAQVSLLTGECAAALMLGAGVGVLRTMPPPSDDAVARLRRHAQALGVSWPAGTGYAGFLRSLDPRVPDHAALVVQSARLARGAGYLAFHDRPSGDVTHAAVAAPYAHVTAPLRRLVDRFANEVVLAAAAGRTPPAWATDALPAVADLMAEARRREGLADRLAVELVEAAVLTRHVGGELTGVVVDVVKERATIQLRRPAVVADVALGAPGDGALGLGDEVTVTVVAADPANRRVELTARRV